jgi:hypothetical protein
MTSSVADILAELAQAGKPRRGGGGFIAKAVKPTSRHLVGINEDGLPSLLLYATPSVGTLYPPLRLQGLEVQYSVPCRVSIQGEASVDRILTTVVCISGSLSEREYFAHAADLLLKVIGPAPDLESLRGAVEQLANIFQRLGRPARSTVTGILGELVLIHRCASPYEAVMSWRSSFDDRFDFAAEDVRIEVKATQGRVRRHFISCAQCEPPNGTVGALVSLFIESAGGGTSFGELVEMIERALIGRTNALLRLHEVLSDTLGQSLMLATSERFDLQLAEQSLLLFDLREVPAIRSPLPVGVAEVRFSSDLTHCHERPSSYFAEQSAKASQLLPR